MNLSPHFTLAELTYTDHRVFDNTPDAIEIANLTRLAALLEDVRTLLGIPIMINSAFRSKEVNAAVGGKATSQHLTGCAADIRVPSMTPDEVVTAIKNSTIEYDQVIREFDRWTHISVPAIATPPRKTALIIDATGSRRYV